MSGGPFRFSVSLPAPLKKKARVMPEQQIAASTEQLGVARSMRGVVPLEAHYGSDSSNIAVIPGVELGTGITEFL